MPLLAQAGVCARRVALSLSMGRGDRVVRGGVALALSAALGGCASNVSVPAQSTPHATARLVSSPGLPPVPSALIADLNRHRASVLVRRVRAGATAPIGERAALLAARQDGSAAGRITSGSLVTMGLPGSLNSASKAWLFGVAHPKIGPAVGAGRVAPPLRGHIQHVPQPRHHLVCFAAQIVNALTGKWVETTTGCAPS